MKRFNYYIAFGRHGNTIVVARVNQIIAMPNSAKPKTPVVRAKLEDVARLAEVSLGSASRALSTPHLVKPKTLARVQQAVAQLGYVRNGAARALASRRTFSVGAVIPTLHNPAFAEAIHTLQQTLWGLDYQLVVASHEYVPEREFEVVRSVVERGVDGLILVGAEHDEEIFDMLRQRKLPLVLIWCREQVRYGHGVGFSDRKAAADLTRTVLAHGHTAIAVACGSRERNERARQRIAGARDAMTERGLSLREDWILEQPLSYEGGRAAIRQILAMEERPTVLMCTTDTLAVGALHECRIQGIRVPEDLSITGYDDIELASLTVPALTTVHIPAAQMGAIAAQTVVSLIDNRRVAESGELSGAVVVRDSLANISKAPARKKKH
jgi:LacI family transcriptional regulator